MSSGVGLTSIGVRRRLAVAGVALVLMAGACSSSSHHAAGTVSGSGNSGSNGSASAGGGASSGAGGAPAGAGAQKGIGGAGGGAAGGSSSGTGSSSSGSSGSPSAVVATHPVQVAGRTLTVSHGVVNGHIQIGIAWVDASQANVVLKGLAGGNAKVGDSKAQAQAVVDYLNAHGGIAGLTIDPVYYQFNASNLETPSGRAQETQAECAYWTQDHHVFAVLVVLAPDDNLLSCAAKTQTPIISAGFGQVADDVQYGQIPNLLYWPSGVTVDQRETLVVDRMVQSGELTPKSKVGVLIEGDSGMFKRAASRTLLPALQRNNIPVASQVVYPDFIDAPWDSYVLQFRQAGVNTVYFGASEGGGWSALFFTRAASNQKWYPQFIMASDLSVDGIGTLGAPDEAPYIHGTGWLPFADTGNSSPLSANGALCKKIMNSISQPDHDTLNMGVGYCETLFFLEAALANSTNITPAGIGAGAAGLGTGFAPVLTRGSSFTAAIHYGANVVQDFVYNASAKSMAYVGKPATIR